MKKFDVAKQPQEILGKKFPAGTVYGHIMLKYTFKAPTGETRQIYDKDGYPVFNNDGTPVIHYCYRLENRTQEIWYAIQDFQPQTFKDGAFFRAWIKTTMDGKWRETPLCKNAWMKQLNSFIAGKMRDNGLDLTKMWFDTADRVRTNRAHEVARGAAHRREVQRSYIYEGGEVGLMRAAHNMTEDADIRGEQTRQKSVLATGSFNGLHGEKPVHYARKDETSRYRMHGNKPAFYKLVETPYGFVRCFSEEEYKRACGK